MSVLDTLKALEGRIRELRHLGEKSGADFKAEIRSLEEKLDELREKASEDLTRWDRVQIARAPGRPSAMDYIDAAFEDFTELHGDRLFGDDPALLGGLARLGGRSVVLLMHQKGRDTKSKIKRRFGMSNPEGYRKAVRLMDMADKFGLPVVALIDTPGAYPGIEAEERGQGWAIAESIRRMVQLKVPAISVVIGEGGSGGALALGVGNRVLIQENAWYSVISPEGAASILWRDAARASDAAEALRLSSYDLLAQGLVEEVISEPLGGAHRDPAAAATMLKEALLRHLTELQALSPDELRKQRDERFLALGVFQERT